jgi:hypothetical protein
MYNIQHIDTIYINEYTIIMPHTQIDMTGVINMTFIDKFSLFFNDVQQKDNPHKMTIELVG